MEKKRCCATCVSRYWVDDNTYCCRMCPDSSVKANEGGMYLFSAEQAHKFICPRFYPQIGNSDYSVMDYNTWIDVFHPHGLRRQYDEYVAKMDERENVNHSYLLRFEYPDAHGLIGDSEETFTDREKAVAAAVEASKDSRNYNITVRHKWWNNRYSREEGCWVEWEKETKE